MRITMFMCLLLISLCTAAGAGTKADLSNFDGIPIGVSEDQVLDSLDKVAPPTPSPTPRSMQTQSLNCPPTGGGLQCAIAALNHNRPQRPLIGVRDVNAGLTPTQIRARAYNSQQRYCAVPDGSPAKGIYDSDAFARQKNREIVVEFVEENPAESCDIVDTEIYSNQQIVAQTIEAQQTIEDEFISAAKAAFGTPTYFIPRHVGDVVNRHQSENNLGVLNSVIGAGNNSPIAPTTEKRTIAPEIAWCDTGTIEDCKSGGPTVNRRLLLSFVHYDGEAAALDLKDFHALRQIQERTTKSNVEQAKPQL